MVVAVADTEGTIGILVVQVVRAGGIYKGVGLIVLAIPGNVVDTHGGMTHIQHLELTILVARIEDELAVVAPFQTVAGGDVGLYALAHIALLMVLHHYGVNLRIGVGNGQAAIVERHRYLLVTHTGVDIGVRGAAQAQAHTLLGNHKLGYQYLAVVVVLVQNIQAIVATHQQLAAVVGQLQLVVGVGYDGVYGVCVILDGVAVEA